MTRLFFRPISSGANVQLHALCLHRHYLQNNCKSNVSRENKNGEKTQNQWTDREILWLFQISRFTVVPEAPIDRPVFEWLSKNQNQSNYSGQSQQGQTARWTNQNSWQLVCNLLKAREKSRVHGALGFGFGSHCIGWKTGASLLSQSLSVAIAIT